MMREYYQDKAKRDARARDLRTQGIQARRSSTGPSQLHPMYVTDWGYPLSEADKGFGNNIYKTFFANLYKIEW